MDSPDLLSIERDFFKRGNPLNKLLSISLQLLGAQQTGILYGTNETRIKFLPTSMWDRGIMDRFDGRGLRGIILKLFGNQIVTHRKLSPIYFHTTDNQGREQESHGIISYVLRNCADYYKKGVSIIICPDTRNFLGEAEDFAPYRYIPFFSYDGYRLRRPNPGIKVDTRIVKLFRSTNSVYIYLPDYGILVVNTADESLVAVRDGKFVQEEELCRRLDLLIRLVETASLAYLGQLKGKKGAELLWRKEKHLRQTSQDLAVNEQRFRDLYENAPIAYFSMDYQGAIFRCNRMAESLLGYDKTELVGQNVVTFLSHAADTQIKYGSIWDILKKGNNIRDMELTLVRKGGETLWISLSLDAIMGENGRVVELRAMAMDISQRKQLENQLLQVQKMEAIGTMARGIAHDFNNVLSPISGYAQMLLMEGERPDEETEYIETILECSRHARDLVSQILAFSRQRESRLMMVGAQEVISEAVGLTRAFLPATVKMVTRLEQGCGFIRVDAVQIHQVVMNLVTNAFHAMESRQGILEIRMQPLGLKALAAKGMGLPPGDYVLIQVRDTGHGIPTEIMDKIFEPYFSTRQEGKGSGIGLSVVHGIVESHGGHIRAEARPNRGARFSIFLPRYPDPEDEQMTPASSAQALHPGKERVLLVDDDHRVAAMHTYMLNRLGYTVRSFTHGPDALDELEACSNDYDLVITDLTMPDLTGVELAEKMAGMHLDLPVILCSGLGDAVVKGDKTHPCIKGYLSKPVEISALSTEVRRVLD
ncbi:MAG: ATP-binding protein [Desulfobacterales bacterium]|nr:ATP-binding protein [Desulfobacterales bacterium]